MPRRRAVDGYINNHDSSWPIITNNTPRDWSLIRGRGLHNRRIVGQKLFVHTPPPPSQDRVKLWWPQSTISSLLTQFFLSSPKFLRFSPKFLRFTQFLLSSPKFLSSSPKFLHSSPNFFSPHPNFCAPYPGKALVTWLPW